MLLVSLSIFICIAFITIKRCAHQCSVLFSYWLSHWSGSRKHTHMKWNLFDLEFFVSSAKNLTPLNEWRDQLGDVIYTNEDFHRLARLEAILNYLENQRDHHRFGSLLEKRAKSIVKGDPREFMGRWWIRKKSKKFSRHGHFPSVRCVSSISLK